MADQKVLNQDNPSGPAKIRNFKVWVDRNLCIGAATCVAVASQTFVLDSQAKAVILETAVSDQDATIIEAAKSCPVAAIFIKDEKGERVFPK